MEKRNAFGRELQCQTTQDPMNAPSLPEYAPSEPASSLDAKSTRSRLANSRFMTLAATIALFGAQYWLPTALWQLPARLDIVELQKSWNGEQATRVLEEWGSQGIQAAKFSLLLDLPLIASYSLALVGWIAWTRNRHEPTSPRGSKFESLAFWGTIVGASADLGENALHSLLLTAYRDTAQVADSLALAASACAALKFGTLTGAMIYVVSSLVFQKQQS